MHPDSCLVYLARALVAQDSEAACSESLDESIGLDSTNYLPLQSEGTHSGEPRKR